MGPDPARAIRVVVAVSVVVITLSFCPWTARPALDVKLMLVPVSALLVAVLLLWHDLVRAQRPRPGFLFPLMAAFVVVNALAGLLSNHPLNSLGETGRLASLFIMFVAASRAYSTRRQLKWLFLTVCVAMAAATAIGFIQRFGFNPVPLSEPEATRSLASTFGNQNYAGHALVLALVLAVYMAASEKSLLACALLPVLVIHLLMTHHRAGMLAAASAATLALVLLATRRVPLRRLVAAGVILTVATTVGAGAALWSGHVPLDNSLLLRYNSFFSASKMIVENPAFGWGPNNYVIENVPFWTPAEQEQFARWNKINDHPHCEPLYAAVSGGLPAAAIFLSIISMGIGGSIAVFRRAPSRGARYLGLMLACFFCAWAIDGLFGFNLKTPVSGFLFAVVAGVFDRATSTGQVSPAGAHKALLPAMLVLVAACFSIFAVRAFAGAVLLQTGKTHFQDARNTLERAETLDPSNWEISYVLWHSLNASPGGNADALDPLQRALAKNPCHLPAIADLAQHFLNAGKLDEAEQEAEKALALCKPFPKALEVLGTVHLMRTTSSRDETLRGDLLKKSRECYMQALANGGRNKSLLHTRAGQTYVMEGDFENAEKRFRFAAPCLPPHPELWSSMEQMAERTGNYTNYIEAVKVCYNAMNREYSKYKDSRDDMKLQLGHALQKSGDLPRACDAFRQAAELDTANVAAWKGYLSCAVRLKRLQKFFDDVVKLNPTLMNSPDPDLHIAYASNVAAAGQPAAARAHLIGVLTKLKFTDAGRRKLAEAMKQLGPLPGGS